MKDTRIALFRPRHVLSVALGFVLACTDEPTTPQNVAGPEFSTVIITDPTRVLTVGLDAPVNLTLTGTAAGIVVLVNNAFVDLSKATVDCAGQIGPDPRIGVWIKNQKNVRVKGGGTAVIRNCDIGVLIGPPDPATGEPGGSNNHLDGLEIHASQAMLVSNSHGNLINSNRLVSANGLFVVGNDPRAFLSGKNKIYDNTVTAGARFSIYASSDSNIIRRNLLLGEAVDAAIAVDRDANVISDNQTEVGPGGDDPMIGILVLGGADDNTIARNQVGAGDLGILVEANTFRDTIRENTAIARSGQDAVDESGNCVNNRWTKNTFRRSDPRCILGITLDEVIFTSPTAIQIEGPGATFRATMTNQATSVTDVVLRSWIGQQGLSMRLGGVSSLHCIGAVDVLPRGTCTQVGHDVIASNAAAGKGTLAVGDATATIELVRVVNGDSGVVDSRSVPVTLTAPAAGPFWEINAPLPTPRDVLTGGVVNGILYAVGGSATSTSSESAVEAYDPVANSWTSKAPLPTPRFGAAAGVVNGLLYVVGGYARDAAGNAQIVGTVEAYDPVSNAWTAKSPMPTARAYLAVGVVNGVIYAVGGEGGAGAVAVVEAYSPATNTWTTLGPMPTARRFLAVGVIKDIIYAAGGQTHAGFITGVVEAYNAATDTWATVAPLPTLRDGPAADVVDGLLYVVGGTNSGTVEIYDPAANSWTAALPMPTPRWLLEVGVVNGVLYTVGGAGVQCNQGGCSFGTLLDAVEAYHP